MIQPVNNHCLIEIVDEFGGIPGGRTNESRMKGVLKEFNLGANHLTASAGYEIKDLELVQQDLDSMIGKTVLYQQYADEGQVIEEDGKRFALVYFWRIMGVEQ